MFGKLLGSLVRIVNAPIRVAEDIFSGEPESVTEDERIFSMPLNKLADELDEVDKD